MLPGPAPLTLHEVNVMNYFYDPNETISITQAATVRAFMSSRGLDVARRP